MIHLKWFWGFILILLLSACQALNAPNVPATLRVQNTAYVLEATAISESLSTRQVEVEATAQAASTTVAETGSVNRVLMATARALIPPTPPRQLGGVVVTTEGMTNTGSSQFLSTGVTSRKRDSDGCADDFETQFASTTPAIYVITQAASVQAGTLMQADWNYEGQMVSQSSWTVPRAETNFCIWFYIDPATVPFNAGSWSVQLSANGSPVSTPISFSIVEAMSDGG